MFGEVEVTEPEKESPFGNAEPVKLAPVKLAPVNSGLMRKPAETKEEAPKTNGLLASVNSGLMRKPADTKEEAPKTTGLTKGGFVTATDSNQPVILLLAKNLPQIN